MVTRAREISPPLVALEQTALLVQDLSAGYAGRPVLRGLNLRVDPGQLLAVIGPNGAGKSTLIRALSGVLPLSAGNVRVAGQDLAALSTLERARRLAVVPQAHSLPPAFTAWEVVLLGRTPHLNWLGQVSPKDEDLARAAMQRTDTLSLAARRVSELSGGEQQRLLLARALAQAAPILLMDEPTAHLDLKYQITVLDQVRALARTDGLALLVALHDLNLVLRYADRVALLVSGELRAFGPPREVLTPSLLSDAYQIPLDVLSTRDGKTLIFPGGE